MRDEYIGAVRRFEITNCGNQRSYGSLRFSAYDKKTVANILPPLAKNRAACEITPKSVTGPIIFALADKRRIDIDYPPSPPQVPST
ncbi:hypothetical protein ACPRNU_03135 [Chromobacterium vaccinii]|uniref:hypothetical protein n=1 Tax=Chromobacterium vaccinii TaxID=1108595 RepID=UPI003C784E77